MNALSGDWEEAKKEKRNKRRTAVGMKVPRRVKRDKSDWGNRR